MLGPCSDSSIGEQQWGVHCPLCTIALHNAEQAAKQQGTLRHTRRFKPWSTWSSPVPRTPTVRSVVNVPPRAALSLSTGGVPAASLDDCKEDDGEEEAFHQFHQRRMQWSDVWKEATPPPCQVMHTSPSKSCCIDLMWQTTKWLLDCETSLEEEEISWWLLVSSLTDGSDVATKGLMKRLMAAWKWVGLVLESPVCPPAPTVLNIGQFLNEDSTGHGWIQQEWLLAYACALQQMGEATYGRMWRPNGKRFTPQISMLVDAFLEVDGAKVVKADVACCWSKLPPTVPWQRDEGTFANVTSHLDNLAQQQPMRKAWDELVCLPPPAAPRSPCQSRHLGYIQGWVVELGCVLPSMWFRISQLNGDFVCMARRSFFEGNVLAYDPTSNEAEWVSMQGLAEDLTRAEEASTRELSNMVPLDSAEEAQSLDQFRELRSESGGESGAEEHLAEAPREERMDQGYEGDSDEERSDSTPNDSCSPVSSLRSVHHPCY